MHLAASALLLAAVLTWVLIPLFEEPIPLLVGQSREKDERLAVLLERKNGLYQSIRDADLDLHTGKLSEADHAAIVRDLKQRAALLLRELDEIRRARSKRRRGK